MIQLSEKEYFKKVTIQLLDHVANESIKRIGIDETITAFENRLELLKISKEVAKEYIINSAQKSR